MIFDFIHRIRRKLMKLRLHPIRVFCFHHVSETFEERTMKRSDWMSVESFKQIITNLQKEGYVFISLVDAHKHLKKDSIRLHKYAVLTADDGWASLRNIFPWLNEQQIPVTLFLNPAYLDGKHFRNEETEEYLTDEEVKSLYEHYPLVTIGSHGWEHLPVYGRTMEQFADNVQRSVDYLCTIPNFVPFYAYTWGRYNQETDEIIKNMNLIPVHIDRNMNYDNSSYIDRELLEE